MLYTGYEFLWLFFTISFLGWVLETVTAAIKQKKFVNRGVVNTPFCVLYGISSIFISIFCRELDGIWLYIGSVIVATVFEWIAGHLIEKIYHEKWWDYSNVKWNLDGYVCLPASAIWGILAFVMMKWGNLILISLFHLLPKIASTIIIWMLLLILALDILATVIVLSGRSRDASRWEALDQWFTRYTARFGQKIYLQVSNRIHNAYPKAKKVEVVEEKSTVFANGCGFHKIVWLFIIGAFLGDITETVYCRITAGVWMSRSSVVWGPFSIVWGLAIAFATMLLYKYRDKSDGFLFLTGTFLGGAYEYVCSVFTEIVFGKVFWEYSHIPFNLGGRINLLYCFFWGIAAVVWIKILYPKVSDLIEKVPMKPGKTITWILVVFMCCNMVVSSMALLRSTQRANGVPAEHGWQKIMDERFDNDRLEKIYPNAIDTE
ncbi:MAG: putative ABC transporter permease [Tyzzerella sp.]|nr:putative ABC transporter permease [Tyzzerella sp.]